MRVELTLSTGKTVTVHVTRFEVKKNDLGDVTGFSWGYIEEVGSGFLVYIRPESVDAVVAYPEVGDPGFSVDVSGGQDGWDGEAAEPGGDELHLERDVEDRDPEKDGREQEEQQVKGSGHDDQIPIEEGSHAHES